MPPAPEPHDITRRLQARQLLDELFVDAEGCVRWWRDDQEMCDPLERARHRIAKACAAGREVRLSPILYASESDRDGRASCAGVATQDFNSLLKARLRPSIVILRETLYYGLWLLERYVEAWMSDAASECVANHLSDATPLSLGRRLTPLRLPEDGDLYRVLARPSREGPLPQPKRLFELLAIEQEETIVRYRWDDLLALEDDAYQQELARARLRQRVAETLRRESGAVELPQSLPTLAEELAQPDEDVAWSVHSLHPRGSNSLLIAEYKTGKTTLALNLLKALTDRDAFLGFYETDMPEGRVAYWNYEVSETQLRSWARDLGVRKPERAAVLNLRGYRLLLQEYADWAAQWLRERETVFWIIDPWARAYGEAENDNDRVTAFLEVLDDVKRRAGVPDLLLVTHTGREKPEQGRERARGATRLDDWADNRWILTEDDGDRFFFANGRDVDEEERRLEFDRHTRELVQVWDERSNRRVTARKRAAERMDEAILAVVRANPGITSTEIRASVSGNDALKLKRLKTLIVEGKLRTEQKGNAVKHYAREGTPREDDNGQ
jgi:hypothetical protein